MAKYEESSSEAFDSEAEIMFNDRAGRKGDIGNR